MKTDRFGILLMIIIILVLFALAMTTRAQAIKSVEISQLSANGYRQRKLKPIIILICKQNTRAR